MVGPISGASGSQPISFNDPVSLASTYVGEMQVALESGDGLAYLDAKANLQGLTLPAPLDSLRTSIISSCDAAFAFGGNDNFQNGTAIGETQAFVLISNSLPLPTSLTGDQQVNLSLYLNDLNTALGADDADATVQAMTNLSSLPLSGSFSQIFQNIEALYKKAFGSGYDQNLLKGTIMGLGSILQSAATNKSSWSPWDNFQADLNSGDTQDAQNYANQIVNSSHITSLYGASSSAPSAQQVQIAQDYLKLASLGNPPPYNSSSPSDQGTAAAFEWMNQAQGMATDFSSEYLQFFPGDEQAKISADITSFTKELQDVKDTWSEGGSTDYTYDSNVPGNFQMGLAACMALLAGAANATNPNS